MLTQARLNKHAYSITSYAQLGHYLL